MNDIMISSAHGIRKCLFRAAGGVMAVFGNLREAERRRAIPGSRECPAACSLGSINIACPAQPVVDRKTISELFEIGAPVCPPGDVLVYIRSPEAKQFNGWIPFKTVASDTKRLSALLIGEVRRADSLPLILAQAGPRVVCRLRSGGAKSCGASRSGTFA